MKVAVMFKHPSRRIQSGFSLIEIMVGMVIGMLAVIIILQMFSNAESSKRTTAGGNDAQINASIALYNLEREVRMAGAGLSATSLLGCTLSFTTTGDATAVTLSAIAPVIINPPTAQVPAGDANTDTLLLMYGNSGSPAEGDATTSTSTSTTYPVASPSSFVAKDYVIGTPLARPTPPNCALRLSKIDSISGSTLTVSNGTASLAGGSVVYNLGQAPVIRAYAIRNGALTMCDYIVNNCGSSTNVANAAVWVPVASNIVSMRAQYGRNTASDASGLMTGIVNQWDQTNPLLETATNAATASPSIFCARARMLAVRMVIVGRSAAYDKKLEAAGGLGNPTWSGTTAVTTGSPLNPTALTIDLSQSLDGASDGWKGYRYKAVETTIPLRNMIWRGGDATC